MTEILLWAGYFAVFAFLVHKGRSKDAVLSGSVGFGVQAFAYVATYISAVALVGFGTFKQVARAARTGFNPQAGEKIKIAAQKVPKFVPGAAFKAAVDPKAAKRKADKAEKAAAAKPAAKKPAAKKAKKA